MGRFISEDPIGFGGGDENLFAYVGNRPVNTTDPFGLIDPSVNINPSAIGDLDPNVIPGYGTLFGDGGVFTRQTFSELVYARERAKRQLERRKWNCKPSTWTQRWWKDFETTNSVIPGIAAPALAPGLGLGALTSGAMARQYGTQTFLQYGYSRVTGAATAPFRSVAGAGLRNFIAVSLAFEAGVAIGAAYNATTGFSEEFNDECICGD